MQKLVQRSTQAKRQAKRKLDILSKKVARVEATHYRKQMSAHQKEQASLLRKARIARREDWELGPLAPRRDAGVDAETYGSVDIALPMIPEKPPSMKRTQYPIAVGDRVVVTKGYDRGRIGIVQDLREDSEVAYVDGLRVADVTIPQWQRQADNEPRPYRSMTLAISLADLRLVFAMTNPETGVKRDVIVEKVDIIGSLKNKQKSKRVIPGTDTVIPWPPRAEPELRKNDDDTTVKSAEERSWVPELLTPPLPEGVIDELRNPFSRFRDRHDEEYIAKKNTEDDKIASVQDRERNGMRTPLQELHAMAKTEEKSQQTLKQTPQISSEVLAMLGEAMAAKGITGISGGKVKRSTA